LEEQRVGFIGLGVMGASMARNLAKKYRVVAFDADRKKLEEGEGLDQADSVHEVAKSAAIVLLSLPSSEVVEEVTIGPQGMGKALAAGRIVIDTSTTAPKVSQEIGKYLEERHIEFLDAPVSGGEKAAREGTLAFMVGGKQEVFNRCLPLLKAMGESVVRIGETGSGGVAKLINNMIVGITFAAIAEGFALGAKSSINLETLFEAIRHGWAGSPVLEASVPAILKQDFRPGGTVNIHWKDLGYALDHSKSKDVPVPVTALVHEIFKAARASGRGSLSQPAIIKLWEDVLKINVRGGQHINTA
jgi:2-hydroxy-3-oxopropionate reductase